MPGREVERLLHLQGRMHQLPLKVIFQRGWFSGKYSACQCRSCGLSLWVRKVPRSRGWQPTPVFSLGVFHEQRSLAGYSPWGRKSQTRLSARVPTHTRARTHTHTLSLSLTHTHRHTRTRTHAHAHAHTHTHTLTRAHTRRRAGEKKVGNC